MLNNQPQKLQFYENLFIEIPEDKTVYVCNIDKIKCHDTNKYNSTANRYTTFYT